MVFAADGLQAGGVVDVDDAGDLAAGKIELRAQGIEVGGLHRAAPGDEVRGVLHEVARFSAVEPVAAVLGEDQRGEGAERFAEFYGQVEARLHAGLAGVGEDGTGAEGAGAQFHAAADPGDDFSTGEFGGDGVGEISVDGHAPGFGGGRGGAGLAAEIEAAVVD